MGPPGRAVITRGQGEKLCVCRRAGASRRLRGSRSLHTPQAWQGGGLMASLPENLGGPLPAAPVPLAGALASIVPALGQTRGDGQGVGISSLG